MAQWTINDKTFKCVWVNPLDWAVIGSPTHVQLARDGAGDAVVWVYIADASVPKGQSLDEPPQGQPHVVVRKAQTAVGNILKSRDQIEFLRIAKLFPYGTHPDDIARSRAEPVTPGREPSGGERINSGKLAQPGSFPADTKRRDDDGSALVPLVMTGVLLDALTPHERNVSEANAELRARADMAEQRAARDGTTFQTELEREPTKRFFDGVDKDKAAAFQATHVLEQQTKAVHGDDGVKDTPNTDAATPTPAAEPTFAPDNGTSFQSDSNAGGGGFTSDSGGGGFTSDGGGGGGFTSD